MVLLWGLFGEMHAQDVYPQRFQALVDTVATNFYDSSFIAEQLPVIVEEYRGTFEEVDGDSAFAAWANQMLKQLKTSHTYYLTPDDYEFYQLAGVFEGLPVIQKLFGEDGVLYPSVGIITQQIEGKIFIASILAGSEAEVKGLQIGDELITLDGQRDFGVLKWKGLVGQEVELKIRRKEGEAPLAFTVIPKLANPRKEFLEAEQNSIRVFELSEMNVGYIHIWSYAGQEYHDTLVEAISWGDLKEADALIIDLRYGLGGASPSYLNIFHQSVPQLIMLDRGGNSIPFDGQWRKPAVYLVNGFSRSGKELLAYGAKKYGLAHVIGERTAGAVLAGRLFVMPGGDLLYLAVRDVLVDGERVEGKGVAPDIEIPMDIRFSAGNDQQLKGAIQFLVEHRE